MKTSPGLLLRTCLRYVLLTAMTCVSMTRLSAVVHQERFDYTNGTILANTDTPDGAGIGGWHRHNGTGGGTTGKITVNDGAVAFGGGNRQDVYLPLGSAGSINFPVPVASVNPGPIYIAFDVSLSGATATGDVFLGLASSSSNIRAGVRARTSGAGYVLGYGGSSVSWAANVLNFGTVHRVVLRYDVVAGSANNTGTLYVFPPDLQGVDKNVEANNTPVISGHVAGVDWDNGVPGPLLNQSSNSPDVSFFSNLYIADNFAEAVGDFGQANVIEEDFTSSAANFQIIAGGTWSVGGGRYALTNPASANPGFLGNISVHNSNLQGDLSLSALVRITGTSSAWNDAAVIFNYQNPANYYYVSLNESNDANTKGIFKVQAGTVTELADITVAVASDTDYVVEIDRVGSGIVAFVNGAQVASATDSTFISGRVGFGTNNDGAQFDDLVVLGTLSSTQQVLAPTFSPPAGTYYGSQSVTIDSETSGATIRYTTNGADPTSASGTLYSGPVPITATTTLKAIAYKSGMTDSPVTSELYSLATAPVADPVFNPVGGTYSNAQNVTITTATVGASIRYTTDGSNPTATTGTVYAGPVAISSSATLKAIAYKSGMADSAVTSAPYFIARYGPNGMHWPANTPKPGTATHVVDVACNWAAIGAAIAAATPTQINEGLHIRVAPGTLPGNGSSSGSTAVLQNLGQSGLARNILVSPRDGWNTVTITDPCRLTNVQGVTFARINGNFVLLTNCSNTSWAQSRLDYGFRMTASYGATVTNCNAYEIVMRDAKVDINDPMGYAAGANSTITDSVWEGIYCAPVFRPVGATDHIDSIQMYGNGFYRGLTIRNSMFWGSLNCALQIGGARPEDPNLGTPFFRLEDSIATSQATAIATRYPLPSGAQAPTISQAINGIGENWHIYASNSIVFGSMYTTKWASVTNSITSASQAPVNNPATVGGWVYDASLAGWTASDFEAAVPLMTDTYLASIWQ